jgi:LPXTG-motif cell wall-anchored protein
MSTLKKLGFTITLLSLVLAGTVQAQQSNFPNERTRKASCTDFQWNNDMLRDHPRVIDACQEVVVAGGANWARLSARYVEVRDDGSVVFNIQDTRGRFIEKVEIQPRPGQVAYINDRATPFERLRTTDEINLYQPEGRYGFGTQPGVPLDELAAVTPTATRVEPRVDQRVAQREQPAMLPQTASPIPFLALAGLLSLLGGLGLSLVRRSQTR